MEQKCRNQKSQGTGSSKPSTNWHGSFSLRPFPYYANKKRVGRGCQLIANVNGKLREKMIKKMIMPTISKYSPKIQQI